MANRLKFRKILRQIHLVSSLALFAFLLMYFVTAFILIRHDWFPHSTPTITKETIPFKLDSERTNYKSAAKAIKSHLKISGREDEPFQRKDSCWVYNIYRPGITYHIVLSKERENMVVTTTEQFTVARVSSRLHLMRHYRGGIKYYIWAFFYDMAALSMLVSGISGVLIWFKMGKNYKNGIYYFLAGTVISASVIIYLMI
jgi:hypothetical protein